jgi:hypothetical protein
VTTTRTRIASAVTAIAAATLVLAAPTAAMADTTGSQFGQHVRVCAQTMGFNGDHNPGMHHGYAGWDGMNCDN